MSNPRLFLVAPDVAPAAGLDSIVSAAAKAGDCACLVVPETVDQGSVQAAQSLGIAVLLRNAEPRMMHRLKADGLHLDEPKGLKDIRMSLKSESLGVFANVSRHIAMEAAEAGADYVAFAQKRQFAGEPIIGWWQDVTDVPAVAIDPVDPSDLAQLLPQRPEFIRPSDAMWQNADEARRVVAELTAALT